MIFLFLSVLVIVGGSMIWAYGILRWQRTKFIDSADRPFVTVLVAGRNEEVYIWRCLKSLLEQTYPHDNMEIIFIDDHSTDQTLAMAASLAYNSGGRLIVLSAPECPPWIGPKKNALKFGIAQAKGEILAFMDADCQAKPGWLASLIREYDNQTGCVAGAVLPKKRSGLMIRLLWLERLFISYTTASAMGCGFPASASGGSFSYRKKVYDQLGGLAHLQVASGDDDLMAQAIAKAGWDVKFAHGQDCITVEWRLPNRKRYINAAIRHQSTTRYYAMRWRLIYLYSITTNILFLLLWVCGIFYPALFVAAAASTLVKWVIEGVSVKMFCLKMETGLSFPEFLLAETVLPIYILVRPVFAAIPGFSWQNRPHRTDSTLTSDTVKHT